MTVQLTSANLEMQFSGSAGAWTSVWSDVRVPLQLSYGITGNGPQDRVASTGTMQFGMENSTRNSGGVLGYYSPGHASCRSGFELGIRCRFSVTYSGSTMYKFVGTLDAIDPTPNIYGPRVTLCTVVDWMDDAAKQKINNVATQIGLTANQLIGLVVSNVTRQPALNVSFAQTKFPYALDTAKDESTTVLSELSKIADSDLGYIFIRGDSSTGGVLTFRDRRSRQNPGSSLASFSNSMSDMVSIRQRQRIMNRVKTTVHPRVVDGAATTVLYMLDQTAPPGIAPGASLVIFAQYTDPAGRANRVGGTDMVTPVSGTDYAFGSGPTDTSLTANLGVSVSYGGSGAIYTLTNNGAVTGYVTLLQARGRGLYDYNEITVSATDDTSKNSYGEGVLTLDMPYETSDTTAQSIADVYLSKLKDPRYYVDSISFVANNSDALMTAAVQREPGDLIDLTETVTGLSAEQFFIQNVSMTLEAPSILKCQYSLTPRLFTDSLFVLDTDVLDGAKVLGF